MITIYTEDFNSEVSQTVYDNIINNLDFNRLKCICGHYGVKIHGYYNRALKTKNGIIRLVVTRVKCPHCNKTHALLLSLIVPYQIVQLKDQIMIINNENIKDLMINNTNIDESDISRIKYNFNHHFKERLKSLNIFIDLNIIINSFKYFKRQFLQIKCTSNILYS